MRSGITKVLMSVAVVLMQLAFSAHASSGKSVAFFYGPNPPVNALSQFDRLVLESENVTADELKQLKRNNSTAFAYLSVGEVGPHRKWFDQIPQQAVLADNPDWNSLVMDLTSAQWQNFLLQRTDLLIQSGYDGLFLDTMDSYQLAASTDEQRKAQQAGLTTLLQRIKQKHPNIRMIVNRGFEVMNKISPYIEAVAAESLYAGWNNAEQTYQEVSEANRGWLRNQLDAASNRYGLDVIVIDYLPPSRRSDARDVAAQIAKQGFIPWVANPALDYVGISTLEVVPRDVIMLFDSRDTDTAEQSEVHNLLAMPLEYMGYVPVYHDIAKLGLPQGILKGSHAGVVSWHRGTVNTPGYGDWLHKQLEDQLPLALFGAIGTELTEPLSELLGIEQADDVAGGSLAPSYGDQLTGFEAPLVRRINALSSQLRNNSPLNTSHMRYKDDNGVEVDTVLTGPWGGLALHPTMMDYDIDRIPNWVVDPFKFLRKSLQLLDAPMPDITTENGNRLWFAHIDGDAMPSWAELPGRRLGAQVLQDEVIVPYDLPHTISIVEGELTALDAYMDRRPLMVRTARELFALDNVEIASHSYSHPFDWEAIKENDNSGRYNLPIPGYKYQLEKEIAGSIKYIDENLAPAGKRTRVMLWSGLAVATERALEIAGQAGVVNINGGNTVISRAMPTVSTISPHSLSTGKQLQVYAPIMNENVFTNEWTGPFDGFRRVIETLEMTDIPRRIKPMNVYYHFYIGTKKSSLRSLQEIYDWSLQQDMFPVFASEYIVKVPFFRSAGVARYLDGRWKITGLGPIRSLRTLKNNAWPDLRSSRSLTGARALHDGIYIHTDGADSFSFKMQTSKPKQPHLMASNAKVHHWRPQRNGQINVRLSGHAPVNMTLSGDQRYCQMRQGSEIIPGQKNAEGNTTYQFSTKDTGDAVIDCKT